MGRVLGERASRIEIHMYGFESLVNVYDSVVSEG
jgi:hypothetical protein